MSRLARVVDPKALERLEGPRGKMRIEVLEGWGGASVRVAVPRQLQCASCDGGGCDRCGRSGALRPVAALSLDVRLPRELGDGVLVRVVHPFGGEDALEVLLIEVRPAQAAAACVLLASAPLAAPGAEPHAGGHRPGVIALGVAALLLLFVLAWLRFSS